MLVDTDCRRPGARLAGESSPDARALDAHLQHAGIAAENLYEDIEARLNRTLEELSRVAEMIALIPSVVGDSIRDRLMADPTDNLILHGILQHARSGPLERKAFLSGNRRDFGHPDVQTALAGAGVNRSLARAGAFLGWLGAQSSP